MLKFADIVVITKGDIVSQAEREVFAFQVRRANAKARIMHVNGITGQGPSELTSLFLNAPDTATLDGGIHKIITTTAKEQRKSCQTGRT